MHTDLWQTVLDHYYACQDELAASLLAELAISQNELSEIDKIASKLINSSKEYPGKDKRIQDLQSGAGKALFQLCECLFRMSNPKDQLTLIKEKLPQIMGAKNFSWLQQGSIKFMEGVVNHDVKWLEPAAQQSLVYALKFITQTFLVADNIHEALKKQNPAYRYSYDFAYNSAYTKQQAIKYFEEMHDAIEIASRFKGQGTNTFSRINFILRLSSLYPKLELTQGDLLKQELAPMVLELAHLAKEGNLSLTIDSEDDIFIGLEIIKAIYGHKELRDWNGFGFVLRAEQKNNLAVLDFLNDLAACERKILPIKLIKDRFHGKTQAIYNKTELVDLSYIVAVKKILSKRHLYGQFAIHDPHLIATIAVMANTECDFEWQRFFGLGTSLYETMRHTKETLAYPIRIHAILGQPAKIMPHLFQHIENWQGNDPVCKVQHLLTDSKFTPSPIVIQRPKDLTDLGHPTTITHWKRILNTPLDPTKIFSTYPLENNTVQDIYNPADPSQIIAHLNVGLDLEKSWISINEAKYYWRNFNLDTRKQLIANWQKLLFDHQDLIIHILCLEAGLPLQQAILEFKQTMVSMQYYLQKPAQKQHKPHGAMFSWLTWLFPLKNTIQTICAALLEGNAMILKPSLKNALLTQKLVELAHKAGIIPEVLQLAIIEDVPNSLLLNMDALFINGATDRIAGIRQKCLQQEIIAITNSIDVVIADDSAVIEDLLHGILHPYFGRKMVLCCLSKQLWQELESILTEAISELKISPTTEINADVGPMLDSNALHILPRVLGSAELIYQTPMNNPKGSFYAPQLWRVHHICKIDLFIPVIGIYVYDDLTRMCRNLPKNISCSVYSDIQANIDLLLNELDFKIFSTNKSHYAQNVNLSEKMFVKQNIVYCP